MGLTWPAQLVKTMDTASRKLPLPMEDTTQANKVTELMVAMEAEGQQVGGHPEEIRLVVITAGGFQEGLAEEVDLLGVGLRAEEGEVALVGGVMAALVAVKREEAMAKEALEAAEEDMVLIVSRLKTRSTFLVYQEI